MALQEKARERLQDVRELEPTSNSELRDRWGMDDGKDVARYLRSELGEYTYRDDDSRIRAVDDAPVADGTDSDGDTADDGTAVSEPGGESSSDPSPSESDEGSEMQRSTASQTPGVDATDSGAVNAGNDDNPTVGSAEPSREPQPAQQRQPRPQGRPRETEDTQATPSTSGASNGLRPAGHSDSETETSPGAHPPCPSCGRPLVRGEKFQAELKTLAASGTGMDVPAFVEANEGADPEWACSDIAGCGYYAENGVAKQFNVPRGGWGKKLLLGAGTVAAAGVAGIAATQNAGQNGGDGILDGGAGGGSGGDRIL